MPNQHKTKLLGWNPTDPTLGPWVRAEAERRGITLRAVLDEMATEYRARHDGEQDSSKEGQDR